MYIAPFAFGAIVGSFLNVVLLRKNTGISVIGGRSRCFSCGKKLSYIELLPILSFIIQRGRCRQCGSKISIQYLIVELIAALLSLAIAIRLMPYAVSSSGFWLLAYGFYFAAFCVLFLVAVYDFKHKIIDRHFLYVFGGFAVANFIFRYIDISIYRNVYIDIVSAGAIFLFFYCLWRFSDGRWMGRGDADLAFFSAVFAGFPLSLYMLLGSFWIGAVVGILLLIAHPKRVTMKSEVPFGPFIAVSLFVSWYFGDALKLLYDLFYF